jgi:DNA-binding SARP family transcriptional activator
VIVAGVRAADPVAQPVTVVARLFGPIEVAAGGRRLGLRDLGGPKAKQVLELLLVARRHNVTKERLADQLWGEALPKRAFAALENDVSVLSGA